MNKKDYMNNLLALCTEKQKDIFNRMYPDGVKRVDWAIAQIENTLKNLNITKAENTELRIETRQIIEAHQNDFKQQNIKLVEIEKELEAANKRIELLNNPESTQSADDQERLDFLSALEAAGVDNWDGYDYAIEIMEGTE